MKRFKVALFIILVVPFTALLLTAVMVKFVRAQSDSVSATVTIGDVNVSLDETTIAYGNMPLNTTKTSFEVLSNSNIGATVGAVVTDLDIQGANSTGGTGWTLAGTAGEDTYVHEFGTAVDDSTQAGSYTALTTSNQTLQTGVSASGVIYFGLRITTPTIDNTSVQQSADVTVLASYGG